MLSAQIKKKQQQKQKTHTIICEPNLTMQGQENSLPNLEEELMMEAWHLLKNGKESLLLAPDFSFA